MITEWTHHPITVEFLRILNNWYEANKQDILYTTLQKSITNPLVQEELIQMKGQIFLADAILDIKTFLSELTEEEVTDENITSTRS